MKKTPLIICALFIITMLAALFGCHLFKGSSDRIERNFDFDWIFMKGDPEGAETTEFDDSDWRSLHLPHDWSIEDLNPETLPDSTLSEGPFYAGAVGAKSTGFTVGGTAWYRKHFKLGKEYEGKKIYLLFEGVYMNSEVWVNGVHMGNHPYGYTSFWYDISETVSEAGGDNIVAVQVKNEGRNSRWYSGSGIYRHVWLIAVEPFHIAPWGVSVWTASLSENEAIIGVRNHLVNASENLGDAMVYVRIMDADRHEVAQANRSRKIEPGSDGTTDFELLVSDPVLWSTEESYLYELVSEVYLGNDLVDRTSTLFGIRTIDFSAESGFLLNGKKVLLHGACMHHDNGPLGARAYDRAEERKVEIMKANGYNAIRTAHNPPSPAFLDACDRLGMMVIVEAFDHWQLQKNDDDYHYYFYDWWYRDIESMVLRDRNHPSVIMWSTGNEIIRKNLEESIYWSRVIADSMRRLDPTRAVTGGVNMWNYEDWDTLAWFVEPMDVVGYNYLPQMYVPDHKKHPLRIMYCSESFPSQAFNYWMPVLKHEWVIGDFVWTGYDYMGEVSIGWHGFDKGYPWTLAYCGDIDLCGFKRPQSFYRDVLWKHGDMVSVFVHNPVPTFDEYGKTPWGWDDVHASWTWDGYEGQELKVDVYSACENVQLLLNGNDLGTQSTGVETEFRASWTVPYQPGELKAIGFTGEDSAAMWSLHTVAEPVRIHLSADRETILSDGLDLSYITVELVDSTGYTHPFAENEIHFEISGPGEILAAGNSNPMSTESFQQYKRSAFQGRCQVIVKSEKTGGRIRIRASGENLEPATIIINSREKI